MNKMVSKFFIFLFVLAMLFSLCACSNDIPENILLPTPPTKFQLNIEEAGNKIEKDFQIVEKRLYAFSLDFLFKEGNQADRDRVRKLSGGNFGIDKSGNQVIPKGDDGVPLTLNLIITKIQENNKEVQIFQKEIHTNKIGICCTGASNFSKELAALLLDIGQYRVSIKNTELAPELGETQINFSITIAYRGK